MKNIAKLLCALLVLLFISCGSKEERTIKELESLAERIERNAEQWSAADWDDAVQYADELSVTMQNYQLDDAQTLRVEEAKEKIWFRFVSHYGLLDEMHNE